MEGLYIHKQTFVIRQVTGTPLELAQILEVYRQCEDFLALGPVAQASSAMVEADLAHSREEGGIYCGVFDPKSNHMLGIIDFVPSGYRGDPELGFLSLLMIAAPYRQRGMGEGIVQAVEEWIVQGSPVKTIHSGVQVNNPAAIRFWKRMGYEIISSAQSMPDGTVAYALSKRIRKPLPKAPYTQ